MRMLKKNLNRPQLMRLLKPFVPAPTPIVSASPNRRNGNGIRSRRSGVSRTGALCCPFPRRHCMRWSGGWQNGAGRQRLSKIILILYHQYSMKGSIMLDAKIVADVRQYISDFNLNLAENIDINDTDNIFEICGISTREMSISSVLAFFLNPEKQHGFGDLFLRNLIIYYNEVIPEKIPIGNIKFSNIEIDTEYNIDFDDRNARADIRIEGLIDGEDFILIIENKIYASEYNPFDIYNSHLKKFTTTILLSPFHGESNNAYVRLLYSEWFRKIKSDFNDHTLKANEKYYFLMQDLFKSMEKVMNTDSIVSLGNILGNTTDDMEKVMKLTCVIDKFRRTSKNLVEKLHEEIKVKLERDSFNSVREKIAISTITWGAALYYSGYTMAFDLSLRDNSSSIKVTVDICCMNNGWNIMVFTKPYFHNFLNKLKETNVKYKDIDFYGSKRIRLEDSIPLNSKISEVIEWAFGGMYFVAEHMQNHFYSNKY